MDLNIDYADFIQPEKTYYDVQTLNNKVGTNENLILHVNIRSINANFNRLELLIENLTNKPSIIVCTETWNLDHYQYFKLKDYIIYYNNSKINIADGVVLYVKENLVHNTNNEIIDKLHILNTDIKFGDDMMKISTIYRLHDMDKTNFIESVELYLNKYKHIKHHIIVGDFNIDILRTDSVSQDFLNSLLEKQFIPGFLEVTRPSGINCNEGSCIDNMFIKSDNKNFKAYKLANLFTDHYPIFLGISNIENTSTTYYKNESYISYNKIKLLSQKTSWHNILSMQDPNRATDSLIYDIQGIIKQATYKKNKNSKKPRKNWITTAIINSCRTKEFLYMSCKREPNNSAIKKEYNEYVKVLNKVIKEAKRQFDTAYINKISNNASKLWSFVKDKIGKSKSVDNTLPDYVSVDDHKIDRPNEIANAMNSFFCDIGLKLSNKIKSNIKTDIQADRIRNTMFLQPTDEYEVRDIINILKEKSGGIDKIDAKTLKIMSNTVNKPLAHIFNLSIEKSIWPDALKNAKIVPIYKSGDKHNISNYRPISIISNIAKIFEKIIYKRIYEFISKQDILTANQFGFVKNRGTINALQHITNVVYNSLDKSQPIIATFIDLAKAFDTVNHQILLEKLSTYGIRGNTNKLVKSYLTGRQQAVIINSYQSETKLINTGVPQGTILGPLFFILYVNDLLTNMPNETIIAYADDTVILSSDKSWINAQNKMNKYLETVYCWLAANKLSLNVNKTVYMTFGCYSDSVPANLEIKINETRIKRVQNCKYLGIIFDYNMKWDKHIEYLIAKTKYLIFIFSKLAKIMQTRTLLMIYYALSHSITIYGIVAWGGAYKTNLNKIQNIQNRLLKIITCKNDRDNIKLPLNFEKTFQLESVLIHYNTLTNMYMNSSSITRNKGLILPKSDKAISDKNSYTCAIKVFNDLSNDLKVLVDSKNTVKRKLKNWIQCKHK